jgi:hypothetical protein
MTHSIHAALAQTRAADLEHATRARQTDIAALLERAKRRARHRTIDVLSELIDALAVAGDSLAGRTPTPPTPTALDHTRPAHQNPRLGGFVL